MILRAFILLTLAWSFSWIVTKFQAVSLVPLEVSILYRLSMVSILLFFLCAITKTRFFLTKKEIPFFIFIGLFNFCLNFLATYMATKYIPSGVVATIFSLSIITSEIISSIAHKRKISAKTIISGLIGFVGLAFFIFPMIKFDKIYSLSSVITGLILSLVMVISYSIGNVLIEVNKEKNNTPLYISIAWGTWIGSLFMLIIILAEGKKFIFDFSPTYILSLAYLVVISSVVGFICLFYLIQTIGSSKVNYAALIYPMIAIIISKFFENYQFNLYGILGFAIIISALAIQFLPIKKYTKSNRLNLIWYGVPAKRGIALMQREKNIPNQID